MTRQKLLACAISQVLTTLLLAGCITPVLTPTVPTLEPTDTAQPPTAQVTPTATQSQVLQQCDDFNDGQLDEGKWQLPTDETLVYEQNGVLNFVVVQPQEFVWAQVEAVGTGQLITELTFTITLESYEADIPGGAGVNFHLDDDRTFSVDVGPGPNGPANEFSFCPNPDAGYDECQHPDGGSFPVNVPTVVRAVWTGERIEFYIEGELRTADDVNNVPIQGIAFYLYGDSGSSYHVTVDDVCIVYQ